MKLYEKYCETREPSMWMGDLLGYAAGAVGLLALGALWMGWV